MPVTARLKTGLYPGTRLPIIDVTVGKRYEVTFLEGCARFDDDKNYRRCIDATNFDSVETTEDAPVAPVISPTVAHPSHYGGADDPFEVIKVLNAWEKKYPLLSWNLLTAIKYIPRAGVKNPETRIEDLEKAAWYLNREIANLKETA
jgi:hypothetical protein